MSRKSALAAMPGSKPNPSAGARGSDPAEPLLADGFEGSEINTFPETGS